jgi:hypothetical protein
MSKRPIMQWRHGSITGMPLFRKFGMKVPRGAQKLSPLSPGLAFVALHACAGLPHL